MAIEGIARDSEPFRDAVDRLRALPPIPDIHVTEIPAPRRLSPQAYAIETSVPAGEIDLAGGRLVILYDWDGVRGPEVSLGPTGDQISCTRFIGFVKAAIEPYVAGDECLTGVCRSWLDDAFRSRKISVSAFGGTVTRSTCERFGLVAGDDSDYADTVLELRAAWSPAAGDDPLELAPHFLAWCDLLLAMVGRPRLPDGVLPFTR